MRTVTFSPREQENGTPFKAPYSPFSTVDGRIRGDWVWGPHGSQRKLKGDPNGREITSPDTFCPARWMFARGGVDRASASGKKTWPGAG
ncbi:hypothetical protein NITHO_3120016 [Nitrolancea hollandica Lb]|uniref:Uncharacterized protein n=1 Tax=Nitrolancea hollandica Lb TaxID=1129897 RepID=I4EHJ2_9BACT|nr:hypothetical protein NITHO_3120016 [Nitrolancea hollandica Lb]